MYNPQIFLYLKEDVPFFTLYSEVPITEKTFMGELILGYSKQKLIYGKVTVEPVLGLYEYELIGVK